MKTEAVVATDLKSAHSVCAQCGSRLSSADDANNFCITCLLRGALEEEGSDYAENARRFDQYELVLGDDGTAVELGRGAMGVTYKAFDTNLRCEVALKVIHPRYLADESSRARFLSEARAAAQLRHRNIASVFHLGIEGSDYFYAMELVEGETIEDRLRRGGPTDCTTALDIALQITRALIAAGSRQLVHHDIKPSNVMLCTEADGAIVAKVIDFGLVRPTAATADSRSGFAGTPHFASPEQLAAESTDARSDIYSLGVTLWFMLSGELPFHGTREEIQQQQLRGALPLDRLAHVPRVAVDLIERLLEVDPAKRPQAPSILKDELHRCIEAVEAGRERRKHRLRRFIPIVAIFAVAASVIAYFALHRAPAPIVEQRPTRDLGAYDRYTRAVALVAANWNFDVRAGQNLLEAERLLTEAVARDPSFFLAYCQLAYVHDALYFFRLDKTPERIKRAEEMLQAAQRLGPDRGETHLALAQHLYWVSSDYDRARAELALAQRSLPDDPSVFRLLAFIDRRQGRWGDHVRNMEHAVELDPRNVATLRHLATTYQMLHRFQEMHDVLDRALAIAPTDASLRVARAMVELDWHGDTAPARETIHDVLSEDPNIAPAIALNRLDVALCDHDAAEAARALASMSRDGNVQLRIPRVVYEGIAAWARGDQEAARTAFNAARPTYEKTLSEHPDDAFALSTLGLIDAALGLKEDAIRGGRHAVELLPVTKDASNSSNLIMQLAIIYTWTGETDLAFETLHQALQTPNPFLTYGYFRLHPQWDLLRGDPRFEKIVGEAAKSVVIK